VDLSVAEYAAMAQRIITQAERIVALEARLAELEATVGPEHNHHGALGRPDVRDVPLGAGPGPADPRA